MIVSLIILFFAGAFLCNCIPHLVSGLQGRPFPSPFAKPSGVGDSSPVVNFLWGFLNLLIGVALLMRQPLTARLDANLTALLIGVFVMGLPTSFHFGKVQRSKSTH